MTQLVQFPLGMPVSLVRVLVLVLDLLWIHLLASVPGKMTGDAPVPCDEDVETIPGGWLGSGPTLSVYISHFSYLYLPPFPPLGAAVPLK